MGGGGGLDRVRLERDGQREVGAAVADLGLTDHDAVHGREVLDRALEEFDLGRILRLAGQRDDVGALGEVDDGLVEHDRAALGQRADHGRHLKGQDHLRVALLDALGERLLGLDFLHERALVRDRGVETAVPPGAKGQDAEL